MIIKIILRTDIFWQGKSNSNIKQDLIMKMLNGATVRIFTRTDNQNVDFYYQGIGRVKDYSDVTPVEITWEFTEEISEYLYPEEVAQEQVKETAYYEGTVEKVFVNKYERNKQAREKYIAYYGYKCVVCDFDFYDYYGEVGQNFIHVHHLVKISDIATSYEIDPIKDLRPVCPNCHAMIHKRSIPYTIEEIKKHIDKSHKS